MRLFIGLDLPDAIGDTIARLIERLRPAAKLRWSPAGNLHVTTKFIGEWPAERLDEMKGALRAVASPPIAMAVRGLGWLPNPHSPRIFLAAVRAPESLAALARQTEEAVHALGVKQETRAYSPHLTLARVPERTDLAELRRRVASLESADFGEFVATQFHLYESRTEAGGSVYTKLDSLPLNQS